MSEYNTREQTLIRQAWSAYLRDSEMWYTRVMIERMLIDALRMIGGEVAKRDNIELLVRVGRILRAAGHRSLNWYRPKQFAGKKGFYSITRRCMVEES